MKRKKLQKNSYGVSNVVAYIFSLSIASMVMLSSVLITDSIIDEKTSQIAGQQAQSLANKIGYGILADNTEIIQFMSLTFLMHFKREMARDMMAM